MSPQREGPVEREERESRFLKCLLIGYRRL